MPHSRQEWRPSEDPGTLALRPALLLGPLSPAPSSWRPSRRLPASPCEMHLPHLHPHLYSWVGRLLWDTLSPLGELGREHWEGSGLPCSLALERREDLL